MAVVMITNCTQAESEHDPKCLQQNQLIQHLKFFFVINFILIKHEFDRGLRAITIMIEYGHRILPQLTYRSRQPCAAAATYVRLRLRVLEWHSAPIMAASSKFMASPPLCIHHTNSRSWRQLSASWQVHQRYPQYQKTLKSNVKPLYCEGRANKAR